MVTFLMVFLRSMNEKAAPGPEKEHIEAHIEQLILATLRLFQDCPASAIVPRKVRRSLYAWHAQAYDQRRS